MQYTDLSADEQKQILIQRRKQYEAEHFNHSVNKEVAASSTLSAAEKAKAVADADAAMALLDAAHAETVKKLKAMDKPK